MSARSLAAAAVGVALLGLAALVGFAVRPQPPPPLVIVSTPAAARPTATVSQEIKVYVAGAVDSPGVYTFRRGARVDDAIRVAGGITAEGDATRVNLAAPLVDGQEILVPKVGDPTPSHGKSSSTKANTSASPAIVNINTATAAELHALPGIGPQTAQKIIDYRLQHGPYTSKDQLLKAGVHKAEYEQIKDRVSL